MNFKREAKWLVILTVALPASASPVPSSGHAPRAAEFNEGERSPGGCPHGMRRNSGSRLHRRARQST